MNTLSLEFDRLPSQVIFTLGGRLDGISASTFNALVAEHLLASDAHVTLECSNLEYVSSAGLREFLMLAKRGAAQGSKVTIAGASGTVAFALELAGFNALFKLSPGLVKPYAEATSVNGKPGSTAQPAGLLGRLFRGTGRG